VVPSEYGIQKKPWFVFTPSYWCGGSDGSARSSTSNPYWAELSPLERTSDLLAAEPEEAVGGSGPLSIGTGVRTRKLRKEFATGVAVDGLDLHMRRGAITSLLGANGAGKTTTISMLTGLIPPSSGDAWVCGRSVRAEITIYFVSRRLFD
jgi:ABC-type glutathione transport system ATPase component